LFQTQNDLSGMEVEQSKPSEMIDKLIKQPNIELVVKNRDTLTQFACQAYLDPDYLPKAQKWVSGNKFVCDEAMEDLHLSIGDIFNFTLPRSAKGDAQVIREELTELRREKMELMREFKLFQHYFFNFWREKSRDVLLEKGYLLD
jgi:hypothetical protein